MKSKYLFLILLCLCGSVSLFASEKVPGGDIAFRLTDPGLLLSAGSSAGGGFFTSGPTSIVINPALPAGDQRIVLNLGYTALMKDEEKFSFGSGMNLGLLIPSRYGVFSSLISGLFCNVGELQFNNVLQLQGSFSKDISERLYVGMGLDTGIRWGAGVDWVLGLNIGAVYKWGTLGFLEDTRFAFALTGLGKPYVWGMPSIVTPKVGIAGTLFTVAEGKLSGAFSSDISFPQFTNIVLDIGFQLRIIDMVYIKSAWQFDLRETLAEKYNLIPAIGLTVKFGIDTKDNNFFADKGWQKSEMSTSGAWQNLYDGVQAVSAGASINLGLRDTEAPEIILWGEK